MLHVSMIKTLRTSARNSTCRIKCSESLIILTSIFYCKYYFISVAFHICFSTSATCRSLCNLLCFFSLSSFLTLWPYRHVSALMTNLIVLARNASSIVFYFRSIHKVYYFNNFMVYSVSIKKRASYFHEQSFY